MFDRPMQSGTFGSVLTILGLIYHNTVRSVRKTHGHAAMALLISIGQALIMVAVFYVMFSILGMRSAALRGDFLLYIMSGIFMFMTHVKALGAVVSSEGPASPMMHHLPMNTAIAIASAALGALYIQVLAMVIVLYVYHIGWGPITIEQPFGAFNMVLLSWFSGVAIGMVFLALKPWFPGLVGMVSQFYQRVNMIASGKMFVANTLPGYMVAMFDWNPLFHTIDQTRGYVFINYNPHFTTVMYPIYLSIIMMVIGMMGEFYTRKRASLSWGSKR